MPIWSHVFSREHDPKAKFGIKEQRSILDESYRAILDDFVCLAYDIEKSSKEFSQAKEALQKELHYEKLYEIRQNFNYQDKFDFSGALYKEKLKEIGDILKRIIITLKADSAKIPVDVKSMKKDELLAFIEAEEKNPKYLCIAIVCLLVDILRNHLEDYSDMTIKDMPKAYKLIYYEVAYNNPVVVNAILADHVKSNKDIEKLNVFLPKSDYANLIRANLGTCEGYSVNDVPALINPQNSTLGFLCKYFEIVSKLKAAGEGLGSALYASSVIEVLIMMEDEVEYQFIPINCFASLLSLLKSELKPEVESEEEISLDGFESGSEPDSEQIEEIQLISLREQIGDLELHVNRLKLQALIRMHQQPLRMNTGPRL